MLYVCTVLSYRQLRRNVSYWCNAAFYQMLWLQVVYVCVAVSHVVQ